MNKDFIKLFELYLKYKSKGVWGAIAITLPFLFSSFKMEWLYNVFKSISESISNRLISNIILSYGESFRNFNTLQLIISIFILLYLGYIKYLEKKHFSINNKHFEQINKNIDNLDLVNAEETLMNLKDDFQYFADKQKYNYYFCSGKIKESISLFKDEDRIGDKTFYQDYIEASKYYKNDISLLNKAIGLYGLGNRLDSKKIIDELMLKGGFNENIYGFYLILEKDNYENFDDLYESVKTEYKKNDYINWILGNICKEKENILVAFEKFYKIDLGKLVKLSDKINYFRVWSEYLQKKFGLNNLTSEGRKEYLELEKFIDSFSSNIDGKNLFVEKEIYNIKAIINSEIKNDYEKSILYYDLILRKNNSGTVKLNKVLTLLSSGTSENKLRAIKILKDITSNLKEYLKLEKNNPNKNILYQAHIILAKLYFINNKEEDLNLLLKDFEDNYLGKLDTFYKRNFNIALIQSKDKNDAKELILKSLECDNCIIYNLIAYNIFNDKEYLDEAYKLYKEGENINIDSLLQLAERFLFDFDDKEKYFNIIDNELNDLSNERYFKNYIITGIELGEVYKIEKKLEDYKTYIGGKEDFIYIRFKSYLEEKKGNISLAIDIINSFEERNNYIELLNLRSYLEYNNGDDNYKETLKFIYSLGKENNFLSFSEEDKRLFIDSYGIIDIEEAIKLCYLFLQENSKNKTYLVELKKNYFKLFFNLKRNPFVFNKTSEDTLIKVKNLSNGGTYKIALDGNSNEKYFDYIFTKGDGEYIKLIGKSKGDTIDNLFGINLGIEEKYEIIDIQNKYIYLHQLNLEKPEELGIIKKSVKELEGEINLDDFFDLLNEKGKKNKELGEFIDEKFTNKGLLSFGVLKHFYGTSYIDLYYQRDYSILKSDLILKLSDGEEIKDIFVDISSILTIFELGIQDLLKDNFNLYISQSIYKFFNNELKKLSLNPNLNSSFSIISDGEGNHQKFEYGENFYENRKKLLENIVNWLNSNCKVESSNLLVGKDKGLSKLFGEEFIDSLLICKDKGFYLYSDNFLSREYLRKKESNLKTFGTENFLSYLSYKNIISDKENIIIFYIKLIKLNFFGLLINTSLIHYLLIKGDDNDLRLVISYVKENYNDLNFIVSSLIYSVLSIRNFKYGEVMLNKETIKTYFTKLFSLILEFYNEDKVRSKYFELIEKVEKQDDKSFLLSLVT